MTDHYPAAAAQAVFSPVDSEAGQAVKSGLMMRMPGKRSNQSWNCYIVEYLMQWMAGRSGLGRQRGECREKMLAIMIVA